MRNTGQIRVLMLGWEYPPRFAGGLGKACQGLSQAMAKLNSQVFFILPTFPDRVSQRHLEVVGARECLIEAGWEITQHEEVKMQADPGPPILETAGGITILRSEAQLFPYGAAPSDEISDNLRKVIDRMASHEPVILRGANPNRTVNTLDRMIKYGSHQAKPKYMTQKIEAQKMPPMIPPSTEIYGKNLWSEIEKFCFSVRLLADTHEVDLIHAHDWMTFPAAFEFQRVTGVPVYLHVHATEYDRSGENLNHDVFRIEREGFRKAQHIFAVSRYTAGIIERLYGVHRKKLSVVYNAPEEESKQFLGEPTTERKPQVVFLGRLTFQKGPDHFLKAAAIVSEGNPDAKFVFCGTGDMLDKLRHQAFRLGIEDRVHFAGFVDPTGVDEILLHSKVLVMPSVSEPFGLVALEAIRCGIPVILSKQSGVREVLHRALQVDFWDHEKLADQILAALRLPSLSQQLVEEGMVQVQQLSWDRSAKKVLEVYHRQIGSTYAQAIGGTHGH